MPDDIEIDPLMLLGILQTDSPKEYMLALQKATIMKQGELINSLKAALGANTNGEQVQT